MGLAIIVPGVSFADANLGKVNISGDVPVQALSIIAESSCAGTEAQLSVSYLPITTTQRGVTWSIVSGAEYATITQNGKLLILETATSYQDVVVGVVSTSNPSVKNTATISVRHSGSTPVIESDYYFPLSTNGTEVKKNIVPNLETNTKYEDGWLKLSGSKSINGGLRYKISEVVRTIMMTVKAGDNLGSYMNYLFSRCSNGSIPYTDISFGIDSSRRFFITGVGDKISDITIDTSINKIAVKRDGDTLVFFLNGHKAYVFDDANRVTYSENIIIGNSWRIDPSLDSEFRTFNGCIKDVYMWTNVLEDEELEILTR